MGDKSSGEGPPPPSPLTGAYLLVVLAQTHQPSHKDYVIHNLTKGFLTWDKADCHVDLEKELQTITAQAPEGEEAKNGERLIQFASENLVTEVLINPQLNTLVQCMRNLLSSFTRHRHIIHAGYTCAGNGAWMLQDGTYSYADFAEMYQEHEVQRVLRAYENTVSVDIHCLQEGDWNNLKGKDPFSKVSRVRLNPKDCMISTPAIKGFLDYLSPYVTNGSIDELLESSDVVGNIRFSHPTLYVFPGGQGDAALFGINGFNMLVDGGFARKACFWDFSRHLDRLDAVLMTRINNGNIQGMTSLLQRKRMDHVYPQIGHFFCNMQERRHPLSPDGDKDRDPLLVNLFDQGQDILASLRHLQLKPQPCYRDPVLEPVNLYHKVGHGKLDMYVISPAKDSREVREFMAKWTTQDTKIFCSFTKRGGEFNFPLCNKVSICALLVWQPANPEDNITRLLFPGSTPQHKIFEGLDKLKNLEFMKHAVCSARTLSPSSSTVGLNVRTVSKPKVPASVDKIIENDEKKIEAVKQPIMKPPIGQTEKQPPKSQPPVRPPSKQKPAEKPKEKPKTEVEVMKIEKTETVKIEKAKPDKIEKTEAVQKIDKPKEKPKRPITKQPEKKKPVGGEKKDSLKSSPTTPKKSAENKISETQPKPEVKSRASSRTKPSPSATPAKSAKEANNRKVLEQKKEATKRAPPPKKEEAKRAERSTAPRKSVPSPSKTDKQQVSPVKGPRPVIKPKQDAKKIVKVEKDVVTESVASTPSTVDVELAKAKEDSAEKEKKVEEIKVAEAAETSEQPSLSKDEEDEILVIEKIEIEGDGKGKPEESIAVHIRNSREDIIGDDEVVKDEANADLPSDEKKEIMKTSDITIPDTDSKQFSEDVQDITKDAPDTSKSRVEFMTTEEASITKEPATDKLTPKEKDGKEKSTDIGDIKQTDESQPDEKFSTTIESGATTAPTLPEDERIPLDEIKEIIEEKYIKEETKEKDIGVAHRPEQPTSLPEVPVISSTPFDQRVQLLKDIVKTPDEVADLPVHEEADGGIFGVDEAHLARDLHRSRDDLLGILVPKKPAERKEDAAEEVKLVKDENEKEDATKDLKEDDIAVEKKVVLSAVTSFDQVDVEKPEAPKPEAQLQKLDDNDPALEKMLNGLIDDEALKSSAVPAILDDEEILDEDKDKETEKEKLLPKESRDLDKDEDVADKASKEMLNEKQVAKSVVEEEIKGQKPVPKDGSPEDEKTEADKAVGGQVVSDVAEEIIKPKDAFEADNKSKSPSPELGVKSDIVLDKKDKSPSPEPKEEKAKDIETVTEASKSPSPKPKIEKVEDIIQEDTTPKSPSPDLKAGKAEAVTKSPSLDSKVVESKDLEPIVSEQISPSPVPKDVKAEDIEAPSQASPELKVGETKDVGPISKDSKSPSTEPKGVKDEEIATTKSPSPEPKVRDRESRDVDSKASKLSSPEPKMDEAKDREVIATSPSPEPNVGESIAKEPKSPSSVPKDDEAIASKSLSPEPKVGELEAIDEQPKSPSPEPKIEEAKEMGAAVKAPKSLSPGPKMEEAKEMGAAVKAPKPPSPEPKMEEAKEMGAAVKAPKSPSPEPKMEEAKEMGAAVKAPKSPSPEPKMEEAKEMGAAVKAPKSPSPEPKMEEAKEMGAVVKAPKSPSPEPKMEEAKEMGAAVKAPKSPSPEPKMEEAKDMGAAVKAPKSTSPEPKMEEAKEMRAAVKAPKSPSPEPKMEEAKDMGAAVKAPKSPSPEPKMEEAKDMGAAVKAPKSTSPEPKMEEAKEMGAAVKAPKSPSPEPKMEEAKEMGAAVKAPKSPSPEPKTEEAKDDDVITKSRSPEPKVGEPVCVGAIEKKLKSPSPEPKMEDTKEIGAAVKASKSPSPEPKMGEAKDDDAIIEASESPEPKVGEPVGVEANDKKPQSPPPEPKMEEAKEMGAAVKASKSPSPEPKIGDVKDDDAIAKASKSPSPEPTVEATDKKPKSPSPEPKMKDAKGDEAEVKSHSPELKAGEPAGVETTDKEPISLPPERVTSGAKELEATVKSSKSPSPVPMIEESEEVKAVVKSPEPKMEGVQEIKADTKSSKPLSPEPKTGQTKDTDAHIIQPTSPAPEAKDVDELVKASKTPSPEPKGDVSKDSEALAKAEEPKDIEASKSSSPEQKDDLTKSELPDKLSKPTTPESKIEGAKDIDDLIKAPKSPSPTQLADQVRSVELSAISPELIAEEAKDLDGLMKASKSPSPEPKRDDQKTKDSELAGPTSASLLLESKAEDKKDVDSQEKVSKSPPLELIVDSLGKVKEIYDTSTSLSLESKIEPIVELTTKSLDDVEQMKPEKLKDDAKSPSPVLIEDESKTMEPQTLSKSPTPEPKVDKTVIEVLPAKTPISLSSEQKSVDPKVIELSKSPTPEPSTGLGATDPEDELTKSPSPQPDTKASSESADAKSLVSKSSSPEPITEVAKGLEPTTKAHTSPSPEPGKPEEMKVEVSSSPEPKIAASPLLEVAKSDEPKTKLSKSPSPEPMTEMGKSPEPIIKASKSPSPEPGTDAVEHADQKAATQPPESLGEVGQLADSLIEHTAKSPEPSVLDRQSPELQSGAAKDKIETLKSKVEDSKLIEPSIKESITSLEPQTQQSKSPSPEPSADLQKSPQFGEMTKQALQKEDILKSVEQQVSISDSITPESIIGKDSAMLSSQPDKVKSPSPEPQVNDLKSTSPLPLGSVDDMINNKDAPGDISTDITEDVTGKKVKTKEELNQELMEEKEVDEVSEPERKDLKNLQTKLDGDASTKTTSESQIDSFGDSKAESSKLEAEKHEKEHEVEQDPRAKSGDLSENEDVLSSLENQIIDDSKINQSLTKKSEESKKMEEASSLEKVKVESKLEISSLGSGMFKMDDRVPSISLREASIEQTSEDSAPHKQAEIDKAPGDLEGDVISTPADRKPSSGEVSTKSTDGDGRATNDEGRKLSDGSELSGHASPKGEKADSVEDTLSEMETSVLTAKDTKEETADRPKNETYEQKVDRLEKSIAGDREMLRELIKANEESKISTQLELDKSQSASIAQGKLDGVMPESSIKDTKVEEVKVDHSLPESIKLEADKDSVEVKSKDDSKDEALVLDLDLPEKLEEVHGTIEDAKRPEGMLESDSKKTVSQTSGTSPVPDTKQVYDELESAKDTSYKTLEPTTESSEQKILDDTADSLQEQPKSESDKVGAVKTDTQPETKEGDHGDDEHSSSPPAPHEGKDMKEDDKAIKDGTDTKSTGSEEIKDAAIKLQESISPEKSPLMDKKLDSLATIDQDLKSTSSTPEPPAVRDTTHTVSGDVKVVDSKVEDVTAEKETEVTSESAKASESKGDSVKQDLSMITSDKPKSDTSVESDKVADIESHITGTKVGDSKEIECEVSKVDVDVSLGLSSTTLSTEPTKADGKGMAMEKSIEETSVTNKEQLETAIKESSVTGVTDKEVVGGATATTEPLQFATSAVDSKQNLESIEPLDVEESKSVTVTAQSIIEKDVGEITTAIVTKAEEESSVPKSLAGESTVVKSTTESTGSTKDSTTHPADSFSLLTNGKTSSDIHETEGKVVEDTAGKEHDVKKSDTRVTDILDTAERIVSSLNGKKTISDEPSDYIPSFSETKSFAITIEGKKGFSDEITVETKTIEESEVVHTDSHSGKEESNGSKVADAGKKPAEDMNGHSKLHKEDECVLGLSSALKYDAQDKHLEDSQTSLSSVGKLEESISKSEASKESSAIPSGKVEIEKLEESSKSVGQSLTKVIGETVTTMGDTVSAIGSYLSGDLLRSSTSSAKGSTTASPELSRKSDDAISSAQHDVAKGISSSKLDLTSKESLIDVTSSFLSMESGISQSSEKSVDISVSSSKSGDKVTETTDQKSSLSSTQVEPPTEKDQPILHSITAALRTQKDFSRSETPASDILSDRDVEIGHCTPFSDTSSGQVSRAVTHVWESVEGRPESRHYDSDEDIPGSPMSISSHIPSPPQFEYDMSRPQDPMMMSSFYGSLPEDLEEGVKALSGEMASTYDYGIHDKSDISLKKELGGDKLCASIRSSLTSTPESSPLPERRFESLLATSSKDPSTAQPTVSPLAQPPVGLPSSSSAPPKPDPIGKWDKPLGLPPPHSTNSSAPYLRWNPYKEWGKPLGLPSPAPPPREDTDIEVDTSGSARTTPKKVSKMNAENNKYSSNAAKEASNKSKRSESPVKKPSGKDSRKSGPTPVYMDLSYVPHHGNSNYATVEFFKRVRARYYVFSGTEPSKEVFNALLEAKQSWEDKDLEVTIIPTYDTDTLGYWIAENEETLSKLKIDLSPSASRCTINLQDHDTSCSAYRLEF